MLNRPSDLKNLQMENEEDDKQALAIKEKKASLSRQLIALVILSFLISISFYTLTKLQNPKLAPYHH